jgi:hypothetical protein
MRGNGRFFKSRPPGLRPGQHGEATRGRRTVRESCILEASVGVGSRPCEQWCCGAKPDQKPGPEFRAQHSGYNSPITGCGFRFKECFLFRCFATRPQSTLRSCASAGRSVERVSRAKIDCAWRSKRTLLAATKSQNRSAGANVKSRAANFAIQSLIYAIKH